MSIASQHGARLLFLHVISEHVPANLRERVAHAARQEIEAVIATARVVDRQSIDIQIEIGQSAEKIISTADQINADLIVFGMHQDAGIEDDNSETTIEKVVRFGHQPVLVVTDQESDRYDKVMIGADFSVYSRRALQATLSFVPGADLDIVHAFQVPFSALMPGSETRDAFQEQHEADLREMVDREMELLVSSAAHYGCHLEAPRSIVKQGEPVAVLRDEVSNLRPDLLVLGTHGRVGLSHMLIGSVAEAILNQPPCDVLVVKAW